MGVAVAEVVFAEPVFDLGALFGGEGVPDGVGAEFGHRFCVWLGVDENNGRNGGNGTDTDEHGRTQTATWTAGMRKFLRPGTAALRGMQSKTWRTFEAA